MWVTTTRGHFSVVQNQDDGESLLVRARSRADLEALTELPPMERYANEISETPDADYPFRIWAVNPVSFADAVAEMVRDIDYAAFKTAVAEGDPERARTYMDAWFALLAIEQEGREDDGGEFGLPRATDRVFANPLFQSAERDLLERGELPTGLAGAELEPIAVEQHGTTTPFSEVPEKAPPTCKVRDQETREFCGRTLYWQGGTYGWACPIHGGPHHEDE